MLDYDEIIPVIRQFADRGFQRMLEAPENVRGLMSILAAGLAEHFDFPRMEVEPARFISEVLHLRASDMVIRVPYRAAAEEPPREVEVVLLFEHQSKPFRPIRVRILRGISRLMDREQERFEAAEVPEGQWHFTPVLPIVLYTGDAPWDAPEELVACVDAPAELVEYVPHFRVLYLNVKGIRPEELLASGHPFAWVLRVLQVADGPADVLETVLMEAVAHLRELEAADRAAWERAFMFLVLLLLHRRQADEARPLVERMAETVARDADEEEVTEVAQTAVEYYLGQGLARGRVEAKRDTLLRLLAKKFGPPPAETTQRVRSIDEPERLDVLIERVLDARDMEAMGI